MLNSKQGCFRSYFGRAFNGKGHTCDMLPNAPKCQRCAPYTPLFVELEQLAAPLQNAGPSHNSSRPACHYSPYPRDTGTARAGHRRPPDNPVSRVRAIPYNPHAETVDTIDLQAAIRVAKDVRFVQKLHAIEALSQLLHGHCGACWALTGRLFTNHHPVFGPCSLDRRKASHALNNREYQNWVVVFQPLTACFRCYMPQVIAWAVLKTKDLLIGFNTTQTEFYLDPQITPKKYAEWLAAETDGIVNMGHLVSWLIEHHAVSRAVVN
ncbi:hypothetical protein B0H10DRAFT_2078556 [Mycena sp. CBHHK59/15]|nr:hypothetical protein B0H10DRAFT_2117979 [Mycena sp. CBHHK59/15]KAJ6579794.1 hypothetical protein B0H10DRAFT_2099582 [Mycena sp. CBHHK59/15]KAJ6603895.1 hypothetical protein B0H10DRAFT_2078556 [Mycena sp. CBHHK59/15]